MKKKTKWLWIDKEILFLADLNLNEKILLAQIISLSNNRGCFANNEFFASLLWISKSRTSVWINSLVKKWYISTSYSRTNNRVLKPLLANKTTKKLKDIIEKDELDCKKKSNSYTQKHKNTINENIIHNNIYNNKLYNKYWEYENVLLTSIEYEDLIKVYDKDDIDSIISKLDKWIESKWYVYKNHYITLLDWIKKAWIGKKALDLRAWF